MSDGIVVLPQRGTVQPPEAGISSRQNGVPLPQPTNVNDPPKFDTDEISIDVGNGAVRIGIGEDGDISSPYVQESRDPDEEFGRNLAEDMDEGTLSRIAEEVIEGVEMDVLSRSDWYTQYQKGLDLLGTKDTGDEQQSGGQRRAISKANDSTMTEAMVKYWAGAEAEMLPAAGPAKVETVGTATPDEEDRAKAFQDDFNYFLTEKAPEYYPDTARMLMHQAYCGMGYKKTYRSPLLRRPTSQSVLATDMIISEEATDLDTAMRVTHRIEMTLPYIRRMMAAGQYRTIDLGSPQLTGIGQLDGIRRALQQQQGIVSVGNYRPQDTPYEIWETDSFVDPEYDIPGIYESQAPAGMPLPYKITLDHTTRKVLGMWRNWRQEDDLYMKRNLFVRYGLVPGMGYSDWGFLQLLGAQTRALRACLRILIDAGLFKNFPAGLIAKHLNKGNNELAPGPGELLPVDLPVGADIRSLVMAFPFNGPDPTFVQLMEMLKQDAMRLGGTVQIEVGEGRSNVPVGTVLAMVEQQVQVMAGIHKGNHRSQKQEFRNLRELFAENPNDFALLVRDRPRDASAAYYKWQKAEEFMDLNLVPASDPNVPSYIHRLLVANVMMMIAQQAPQDTDVNAILSNAFAALGVNPSQYVIRPEQKAQAQPPPDPRVAAATIKAQSEQQQSITEAQTQQGKLALEHDKLQIDAAKAAAQNETARTVEGLKQQGAIEQIHHAAKANPPEGEPGV